MHFVKTLWILHYHDPFEKNKTSKNIKKFIKDSKITFPTIQMVECCIVTTKSEGISFEKNTNKN